MQETELYSIIPEAKIWSTTNQNTAELERQQVPSRTSSTGQGKTSNHTVSVHSIFQAIFEDAN